MIRDIAKWKEQVRQDTSWGQTLRMGNSRRKGLTPQLQGCTPFEREVLEIVSQIPFGQTRSYKWVAKKIGRPKAARAVGQALKKNPLPLIIPCHRVVRSDGKIGGYRWGEPLKMELLHYEKLGRGDGKGAGATS